MLVELGFIIGEGLTLLNSHGGVPGAHLRHLCPHSCHRGKVSRPALTALCLPLRTSVLGSGVISFGSDTFEGLSGHIVSAFVVRGLVRALACVLIP